MLKYQNTNTFFQKAMFQIGLKKFSLLQKLKTLFCGHAISDLKVEEIVGTFYKKELKKKEFRIEKVIKRKGDKLYAK